MKELYKGKYKGITLRAQWWNYRKPAGYFVTFNVQGRKWHFGKISNGKMELSAAGKVAETLWREIPGRFPYLEQGEFVVMPDHIHRILILKLAKQVL
jgi:putative transposase